MKDFESLSTEEQTNVIMSIGAKLDKQEMWYWMSLVHLLREQDKEIERLNNIIKEAINYIDNNTYYKNHKGNINIDDLYIILQKGSDKE